MLYKNNYDTTSKTNQCNKSSHKNKTKLSTSSAVVLLRNERIQTSESRTELIKKIYLHTSDQLGSSLMVQLSNKR